MIFNHLLHSIKSPAKKTGDFYLRFMIDDVDNKSFYKSRAWSSMRARVLRRDGYLCQDSKRFGKFVPARVVHHIYPIEYYPQYKLAKWNLTSLSVRSHEQMHNRDGHRLSLKGWRLLEKTARTQGITVTDQDKYKCLGIVPENKNE